MDKQNLTDIIKTNQKSTSQIATKPRIFLFILLVMTLAVLFATNAFFTSRFSEVIKQQGQYNLTKNTVNILNELQKNSIMPQLLVNDQEIKKSLIFKDFSTLSDKFSFFLNDVSIASVSLLDKNGKLVAFNAKKNFERKFSYQHFFKNNDNTFETIITVFHKQIRMRA